MSNRQITDVITQILKVIPEDEKDLRADLNWLSYDSMYKAPEQELGQWIFLAQMLTDHIGAPKKGHWSGQVSDIVLNK